MQDLANVINFGDWSRLLGSVAYSWRCPEALMFTWAFCWSPNQLKGLMSQGLNA